jgi:hypothetical protein
VSLLLLSIVTSAAITRTSLPIIAMASKHHPQVDDTIESAEMTAIQQPHGDATSTGSNERDGSGSLPEVMREPVQRRSTFRTFTIMVALFVSRHKLWK